MAYHELYVCDGCGADEILAHAVEWTTDRQGEIVVYTGSGKVYGLANRLWCPVCRAAHYFPFVTLNPPADHAVVAYAEAQKKGCNGNETGNCSQCGTAMTWQLENIPCPNCADGVFQLIGEWEDAL